MTGADRMDFEAMRDEVRRRLGPDRFRHTLGVVETAVRLAKQFGVDEEKARLAALLHDVAKDESKKRLLNRALDFGIVLTEIELRAPELMHAPVGREVARREFGVEDEDVLAAIRWHTTGRAGMSPLEKVIFLADAIEPGRDYPGVEEIRRAAAVSLDGAVLLALDKSLLYLIQRGKLIDPHALAARNALLDEGV